MKLRLAFLLATAIIVTGCRTYVYRVVQPPGVPTVVDHPVALHYDPLDYELVRSHDRLLILITNPTADRLALIGNRSFVVDPRGESHPLRGQVLGPHSYARLSLPPPPVLVAYPDYWSWGWGMGWGPGWYDPFWGPFYGAYWGPPPVSYSRIITPFDWSWKEGAARVRLTYERNAKTFEHDFEIVREPKK